MPGLLFFDSARLSWGERWEQLKLTHEVALHIYNRIVKVVNELLIKGVQYRSRADLLSLIVG